MFPNTTNCTIFSIISEEHVPISTTKGVTTISLFKISCKCTTKPTMLLQLINYLLSDYSFIPLNKRVDLPPRDKSWICPWICSYSSKVFLSNNPSVFKSLALLTLVKI